jgi:deoxyhypusine synthase
MNKPMKVKTYSLKQRSSKVQTSSFAHPPSRKSSFLGFYRSLPKILKGNDIREVVNAVVGARKKKRSAIWMAGAHVIKCGLNPVLIELIREKAVTCLCLNGAGLIHDFETAFQGTTSEDVGENLKKGMFGMARETAEFINQAVEEGVQDGLGLGNSLARKISRENLRFKSSSLLYHAYKHHVPVCCFVAVGTDIIHQHPSFNAGLTAEGSLRDFHLLAQEIRGLNQGGVVLNLGSAVILPEVFLKALNLARNMGHKIKDFTTANFDMIYQYRPAQNVCSRPVMSGGKGYYIIGHHEIMLPFLAQAIVEQI